MAIRVIIQSNPSDHEERIADIGKFTTELREQPGCVVAEAFRSTEVAANLMHMQIWDTAAGFDQYWRRRAKGESGWELLDLMGLDPADHYGPFDSARTVGQSGVEIYDFAPAAFADGAWQPDDGHERPSSVHYPAWGGLRIIYSSVSDPSGDRPDNIEHAQRRRGMAGCDQFERFRGLEFPENNILMETWTQAAFDLQWEVLQRGSQVGRSRPVPAKRRYGFQGGEWYHHCFFVLEDGVWQPEEPKLRSTRVRW